MLQEEGCDSLAADTYVFVPTVTHPDLVHILLGFDIPTYSIIFIENVLYYFLDIVMEMQVSFTVVVNQRLPISLP